MCGIAGIISLKEAIKTDELDKMSLSIAHRGVDASGMWIHDTKKVGFAHRRLSIIDLTANANQPFVYQHITLIFNGEIYNYIENKEILAKKGYLFSTQSDTEVLCALYIEYGENMFKYIDGAFAFALWDDQKKCLYLARDRFGEKPLYYTQTKDFIYFASEMKAFWAAGLEKNTDSAMIYNYLMYDVLENPFNKEQTFYKEVKKLKASHFLKFENNKIEIKPYWQLEIKKQKISIQQASETLYQLLELSIQRRLRSDVNIGTSFSGGLDSSLIVEMISRLLPAEKQMVFSARFKNYIYDETKYQNLLIANKHFNSFEVFPNGDDFVKNLFLLFDIQEEPFGGGSVFSQWCVMKTAKENNVKVMLDGQGADEILGGYPKYANTFLVELIKKISLSFFAQKKKLIENEVITNEHLISTFQTTFIKNKLKKLRPLYQGLKKNSYGINPQFAHQFYKMSPPFKVFTNLSEHLHYDTTIYGLEKLLRIADKNAMYHGVEVRLPYLNHEFVEFAFSLPSVYKINNGYSKYILRNMANDILPFEIVWRKQKVGYKSPIEDWVKNKKFKEIYSDAEKRLIKNGIVMSNHSFDPMKIVEVDYFMR